eukprot:jgi/Ulvmu1/11048/UM007_0230.1
MRPWACPCFVRDQLHLCLSAMSAELPPPRLYSLKYDKLFEIFISDPLNYDSVFSVKQRSVGVVEFRHTLTTERQACLDPAAHSGNGAFVMNRSTKYMGAVAYLIENEQRLRERNRPLRVRATWNSAMAPYGVFGRPQRFTTHGCLSEEMAMMQVRWVAAAWQHAQQELASMAQQRNTATDAATAQPLDAGAVNTCLQALRAAAGAAEHAADTTLPRLQEELERKELYKVPEAQPWFLRCLGRVLLAQAQCLFAYNALLKGSAAQLTVALFIGASDIFEEAVKMINAAEDAGDPMPCGDFKKFIVLSSAMALVRARMLMAAIHLEAREAGRASVAAKHAENELAQCAFVAEGNEQWTRETQAALAEAEAVWGHYDRVRWNVYCEPPSKDPPNKLPEGRQVMTAIQYTPPRDEYGLEFECV